MAKFQRRRLRNRRLMGGTVLTNPEDQVTPNLCELPTEVIFNVIRQLNQQYGQLETVRTLLRLEEVSKKCKEVLTDDYFWENIAQIMYPDFYETYPFIGAQATTWKEAVKITSRFFPIRILVDPQNPTVNSPIIQIDSNTKTKVEFQSYNPYINKFSQGVRATLYRRRGDSFLEFFSILTLSSQFIIDKPGEYFFNVRCVDRNNCVGIGSVVP